MGILSKILSLVDILKQLIDFISSKVQQQKRKNDKKSVENLSEKTEKNIKEGNLDEINKNL